MNFFVTPSFEFNLDWAKFCHGVIPFFSNLMFGIPSEDVTHVCVKPKLSSSLYQTARLS